VRLLICSEDLVADAAARGREALAKRPHYIAELEHRGRERALIYKTLLLTGLRKGELASLPVGQLELAAPQPFAILNAADEKNRKGSEIALRVDLAADLRAFLGDRLKAVQDAARRRIGEPIPMRLPPAEPLFDVPTGLIRILDRDLEAAGIPKRDDRRRVVDVHAMRTTLGTHVSNGGVALRTAQAALRHSKPDLTANVYTDPHLLDVAGAVKVLPELPLDAKPQAERAVATGTDGDGQNLLVLLLVPDSGKSCTRLTTADKSCGECSPGGGAEGVSVSGNSDVSKGRLATPGKACRGKRVIGLEPTTFTLAT